MSHVRIVRVDESNWQDYREARLRMLREHPRAFGSTHGQASQRSDEQWRSVVASAWLWLAYADAAGGADALASTVVGSVGMWADPQLPSGAVYLIGMWVDPAHRGAGVADALVRQVLDTASAQGFDRVLLDVADENDRAIACYRRLGFSPTGRTGHLPWDETITESEYELHLR